MQKFLRHLFFPEVKIYQYNVPREIIIKRIDAIFNKSGKFLSGIDFKARLTNGNAFEMSSDSGAVTSGNAKFGSVLYGKVKTLENQNSQIEVIIKVGVPLKLIAIVSFLLGFTYLYEAYREFSWQYFFFALIFIFVIPIICNWFGGVFNTAIRDRFERYIDKEFTNGGTSNVSWEK
jgi:ABC-type multidrug transport system permease subunit